MRFITVSVLSFLMLQCFVFAQNNDGVSKNAIRTQQNENRCVFSIQDTIGIISAYWSFGDPASGAANNASAKVAEHVFSAPGTFAVTVMIVYSSARSETLNTTVIVQDPASKVTFQSVITPDGDKRNEDFGPEGPALVKCHLTIFSRWGNKVFDQESANPRWDGTSEGKPCAAGTYYFIADICYNKDGALIEEEIHGNVTVIR